MMYFVFGRQENVGNTVYQHFLLFQQLFNPLLDMPILVSSNSSANKDVVSKEWTNGDTIV